MVIRTVVAMSGGVDSSVAAALLLRAGHEIFGVSMQVWDYRKGGGSASRATCCAPADFDDARLVAAKLGFPFYVFDFEAEFKSEVIDRFVSEYRSGRTPNPCVECNRRIKFAELRRRADRLGADKVATGHYARIEHDTDGYHLYRAKDIAKDQTYFLYALTQNELASTLFPLGNLTKTEVREAARELGLVTAEKPESQDICFVSGNVNDFLVRLGTRSERGQIVDRSGRVLGWHDGIQSFTVGQRRGLGVGGNKDPLYVLEIDAQNKQVIVGRRHELERDSFIVEDVTWCAPKTTIQSKLDPSGSLNCHVQARYRHSGVAAMIKRADGSAKDINEFMPKLVEVLFKDDWTSVAPGQAAVFYDQESGELLGGGTIARQSDPACVLVGTQANRSMPAEMKMGDMQ